MAMQPPSQPHTKTYGDGVHPDPKWAGNVKTTRLPSGGKPRK